jgi:hypothetical protein
MSEDEKISSFFVKVYEVVNTMNGLGKNLDEVVVVQKVLRYLPSRLDAKVFAIEEIHDIHKMTMDGLHGILIAYDMRTNKELSVLKEATFKASTKSQEH